MALNDIKTKSFWARPEGTTGMLALAGTGAALFFALPALLAFMAGLIALLGQTIAVVALCLLLGALLYVITNKKVQTLVSYMFKSAMRKLTGWFVEIDPIGIMKSYIEDLRGKREIMLNSKEKLQGQIVVLSKQIEKNTNEYNNAMATVKVAKDKGMTAALTVNSRQAGRLEKMNSESLGPLLLQMKMHLRALDKYYEVTGTVIDDLNNEVKTQQIQRDMITSSYSAMSAAKKILRGGTNQKELFDQAMEYVVDDYGMKMGEIDSFIESSKGFVEGLDLQNGVYEEAALEKLKAWENKADSILLGSGKQQLLEQAAVSSTLNLGIGLPAVGQVDFSHLINRR